MKRNFGNVQLAGGEGAGFIENGVFRLGKAFAVFGAFDKNAVFGGRAYSCKVGEGNGEYQSAGAA